ncbi:MAG: hypothetical protein HQ582_12675, partial [Planctomycetes bacterium]|nr:hypothetical protein [Planctomycetota bacterium]
MNLLINSGSNGTVIAQQAETVKQWTFNTDGDKEGWTGANCLRDVVVQDGVLRGIVTGRDPFIVVSGLDIPARPWNVFRARLRIVQDEPLLQRGGELFYANSNEGPYGGYSQAKTSKWTAPDANNWEVVSIYPFWSREGNIIKLRLDFPAPAENQVNKAVVEIDWIEVADLKLESQPEIKPSWNIENDAEDTWDSPLFSLDAEQIGDWLTISASVDAPRSVEFSWMNERGVFHSTTVELKKNLTGLFNVNLANSKYWKGSVHQFKLRVLPDSESKAAVTFQSLAVNRRPQGPANIDVMFCGIEDAIVRAGYETAFFLDLVNCGGEEAPALTFDSMKLPEGVLLIATDSQRTIEPLKIGERRRMLFPFKVSKPVEGTISFNLIAREEGTLRGVPVEIPISVLPSLNLRKADYVPEPKPVKSEYEIGALYFPGWYHGHSLSRVWNRCPDRRPLLGWYNESSPE